MSVETTLDELMQKLRTLRELSSGFAPSVEIINSINFEDLDSDTLDIFLRFANLKIESDKHKLELMEKMPIEMRNWPIEADFPVLLAGVELGKEKEAFEFVKIRFLEGIGVNEEKPKIGF